MISHTGQQIIAIQILSNNSKSPGKQAIKLDQLIKYVVRNIFL